VAAAKFNILIEQGTDFNCEMTAKSGGVPINLTGCALAAKLKKNVSDAASVADFSFVISDQTISVGKFFMKLTHVQTSAIPLAPQKTYKKSLEFFAYDIECTYSDGTIGRLGEGIAAVSPEVTK
jgi:hypothetical protein